MIGEADRKLIVEVVTVVENKGLVRHKVRDFTFGSATCLSEIA